MTEKEEKAIIATALERGEIRIQLELWKYLPVIESLFQSMSEKPIKRDTLVMSVLEEVARDAWNLGRCVSIEHSESEYQNEKTTDTENT